MPTNEYVSKIGGVAAILGIAVLLITTSLHPSDSPPADAARAFAEYAADRFWVATHLGQLLGVVFISAGFVSLSWRLHSGRAGVWALLGAVGAVASLALAGALQAVDGIALKITVDRWSQAASESRAVMFEAAFAVRQIEVGLASVVILFFGVTAVLYAGAFWSIREHWLGWLALAGGVATMVSGIVYAHTGFSDLAMMVGMPSFALLLLWIALVGVFLLRGRRPIEG